ncbi:hypothetical protein LPJ78_004842 [Coemansia sp. RSA 989]|nr:hypothetical protein BX667DRAFT_493154 [Coemansia mojavensis]KAJ1739619.1 hypothetical protein LPJ68_004515 [Coemansia sp. RSA 1086]KAJ1748066.1 hypothetical protein LPJ79_004810 [Coemansia sp. RSA 1821]KAJ1862261.1 hypothetical protein LPJ78_004842 [Coemansia sp. RSA 989]KAJ2632052.1 serine-type endopeptidase activity protein [Coemansia sp. RSA 1290]KAJ2667977.1 hypothetical protein IWW42_005550 [Coemansia sp. RSA 1085]
MRGIGVLSRLTVGLSLFAASLATAAAGQHTVVKRLETSSVLGMKGGILVKNGTPTTCELALVSNKLAFVAANCLEYKPNSNILDDSASYQVMVSDGGTGNVGTFSVESTEAHPKYNPITFANNVAIVKFSGGNDVQWKNYIAANPSDWSNEFYVKRSVSGGSWAMPQIQDSTGGAPAECGKASPLYASNTKDFMCTNKFTTTNKDGKTCASPFGTVYGVHDPNLAVAAIYSHSVVVGDSLCDSSTVYSYYTVLSNYLEWGGAVAGSTIYLYTEDMSYINNNDPNYAMVDPSGEPSISGLLVGGDLNSDQGVHIGPSSSSEDPAPTSSSAAAISTVPIAEEPSSSPEPAAEEEEPKKNHLTTIIIIIAAVLLLLAIIGYILWRKCRKRPAPTNMTTQYNDHQYAMGAQDYAPEYADDYNPNRQHLDNRIISRDSYPEDVKQRYSEDDVRNRDLID